MSTHTTYFITASKDDINITEVCLDLEQLAFDLFFTKNCTVHQGLTIGLC
jgi:hypothetical protein